MIPTYQLKGTVVFRSLARAMLASGEPTAGAV
jgi:hypothetical protein